MTVRRTLDRTVQAPAPGPNPAETTGPRKKTALESRVDAPGTTTATAPNAPTPVTATVGNTLALEQLLSRQQLRLIDAQTYLSNSLATAPLVGTASVVESKVSEALVSLARGGTFDARPFVKTLRAAAGDATLALLTDAMRAHGKAIAADLEGPARTTFENQLANAVSAVEGAIFSAIVDKPAQVDRRRAMASMIAASQTLDGERAPETWMYNALHKFTNESGLPATLAKVERNDGAAIGVSGALLDVAAARRSSLVVLTDVTEPLKDWYLLIAGVLLVVDELAEKHGWDGARRASEVTERLVQPEVKGWQPEIRGAADKAWKGKIERTLEEIAGLGVPDDQLFRLRLIFEHNGWDRPPKGTWLDDPNAVEHLTSLAREGRIVATMTDLADPKLADRLNPLLAAHGVRLGTVHLSNALDYTPGTAPIVSTLTALPQAPGASFIACTDGGYGFEFLGGFNDPRAQPLASFLGDDGIGAKVDRIRFASGDGARLWQTLVDSLGADPALKKALPSSFADFVAKREALVAATLDEPEKLRKAQEVKLGHDTREQASKVATNAEIDAAMPRLPKNAADLERTRQAFETAFWTPKRRQGFVSQMATRFRADPQLLSEKVGPRIMHLPFARFAYIVEMIARSLPDVPAKS